MGNGTSTQEVPKSSSPTRAAAREAPQTQTQTGATPAPAAAADVIDVVPPKDPRKSIPKLSSDTPSIPPAITQEMIRERFRKGLENQEKEDIVFEWAKKPRVLGCDPIKVHNISMVKVIEIQNEKFKRRAQRRAS